MHDLNGFMNQISGKIEGSHDQLNNRLNEICIKIEKIESRLEAVESSIKVEIKSATDDTLQLEVGKFYKTISGQKVFIFCDDGSDRQFMGVIINDEFSGIRNWTKDGFLYTDRLDDYNNIVIEWKD